jgi:hypothetical protein
MSITMIEIVALLIGVDGHILTLVVGILATIAGWQIKKAQSNKRDIKLKRLLNSDTKNKIGGKMSKAMKEFMLKVLQIAKDIAKLTSTEKDDILIDAIEKLLANDN